MEKSNDFLGEILNNGPSQSTFFLVLKKMKEEGRSSEVIQECQKALSLYPDDLRLRTLLAESYLDLGFIGLAEKELARLLHASEIWCQHISFRPRFTPNNRGLKRPFGH